MAAVHTYNYYNYASGGRIQNLFLGQKKIHVKGKILLMFFAENIYRNNVYL